MDIAQDGNLFPREDILEAVAQSDWRDQPVPAAAWWIIAIGLVIVALGTPVLAPLTTEPTAFAAAGDRLPFHPFHRLARWLGEAGMGIESAWYLLSALCLGLSLPALGGALRVLGIGPRLALVTSLLALLTPIALLHGRLPSDFTVGILASANVLAMTFAPSDPGRAGDRGYGIRLGLALAVAVLFQPLNVLLSFPLLVAARARGGITAMLPVVGATFIGAFAARDAFMSSTGEVLRGTDAFLGFGALPIVALLAWQGSREEQPPPVWLAVWWGVGLLASVLFVFADHGAGGPAVPMLIPVYAALVAGALARFARPDNAFRVAAALAAVQALLLMTLPWLQSPSTSMGLATSPLSLFEESDQAFVTAPQAESMGAYLLRRRFGVLVYVMDTPPTGERAGRSLGLSPNPLGLPWTLDPETGILSAHE